METPTAVQIFLGLGITESRIFPGSRQSEVRSILQQVAPEIVFDLTEGVFVESVRSLRSGEGESPPTRGPWVRRLVGSRIGGTANAIVGWSGKTVVLVNRRRWLVSGPC